MTKPDIITRNESTDDIRHSFSKVAWFYDIWGKLTESKAQDKIWEYANIQNGDTVLEVAVGTGIFFRKIVGFNSKGFTYGIDLSPDMIEKTKSKLKELQNKSSFSLKIESAEKISCDANSVDILLNSFMLDLLPEEKFTSILNEFYRVLKPSGKFVITCMAYGPKWYHKFWFNLSRRFPELLTYCRPVDLTKYMENSGFTILKKTFISQNTFPSEVILAQKNN